MSNISAALLYSAMTFFKNSGYHFITVPMLVDEDVIRLTLPHDRQPKFHNQICLENGFFLRLNNFSANPILHSKK